MRKGARIANCKLQIANCKLKTQTESGVSLPRRRDFLSICNLQFAICNLQLFFFFFTCQSVGAQAWNDSPVGAPTFSEDGINIYLLSKPQGAARHGYGEYVFQIINTTHSARRVGLTMPADDYGGDSVLSGLSSHAEVPSEGHVLLRIYQPSLPLISGQNVRVTIDGRVRTETIPLDIQNISRPDLGAMRRPGRGSSAFLPLVLLGPGVRPEVYEPLQNEIVPSSEMARRSLTPDVRRGV